MKAGGPGIGGSIRQKRVANGQKREGEEKVSRDRGS